MKQTEKRVIELAKKCIITKRNGQQAKIIKAEEKLCNYLQETGLAVKYTWIEIVEAVQKKYFNSVSDQLNGFNKAY